MNLLYTIGHGTLSSDDFTLTLRKADIAIAADVRRFAGSRRHPQFGAMAMDGWLQTARIGYRTFPDLGGRRDPAPESRNVGLRNAGFRGYADHMDAPEWRDAFARLLALAREAPTAIFCAETLWWNCHRRLIADAAVLLAGFEVVHLARASRATHVVTPGVRVAGDGLIYESAKAGTSPA